MKKNIVIVVLAALSAALAVEYYELFETIAEQDKLIRSPRVITQAWIPETGTSEKFVCIAGCGNKPSCKEARYIFNNPQTVILSGNPGSLTVFAKTEWPEYLKPYDPTISSIQVSCEDDRLNQPRKK